MEHQDRPASVLASGVANPNTRYLCVETQKYCAQTQIADVSSSALSRIESPTWNQCSKHTYGQQFYRLRHQAPVPLSIFRSNSKFDENSKHSSVKYTRPITTMFCTRHDSVTVVTCATYRCDRSNIFETRAFWIFIEFRIRSKCA